MLATFSRRMLPGWAKVCPPMTITSVSLYKVYIEVCFKNLYVCSVCMSQPWKKKYACIAYVCIYVPNPPIKSGQSSAFSYIMCVWAPDCYTAMAAPWWLHLMLRHLPGVPTQHLNCVKEPETTWLVERLLTPPRRPHSTPALWQRNINVQNTVLMVEPRLKSWLLTSPPSYPHPTPSLCQRTCRQQTTFHLMN